MRHATANTADDRLLTTRQVMDALGLSRSAVYQLLDSGRLPSVRPSVGGKTRNVRASDLAEYVASLSGSQQ